MRCDRVGSVLRRGLIADGSSVSLNTPRVKTSDCTLDRSRRGGWMDHGFAHRSETRARLGRRATMQMNVRTRSSNSLLSGVFVATGWIACSGVRMLIA